MEASSKLRLRPRPTPDPSVLRPSIGISISGMKQAVATLENGTPEIRNYLLNECNVIYECKTCYSMFRSLANFISHKRSYCDARSQDVYHVRENSPERESPSSYTTVAYVEPEPIDTLVPEPSWDIQDYSPSLSLLKEAGFIDEIQSNDTIRSAPSVKKLRPDLNTIIHQLKYKKQIHNGEKKKMKLGEQKVLLLKEPVIRLERMTQTQCAMFQTVVNAEDKDSSSRKTMGQMYVELEKLRQRPTVMAGPDGKVIEPDTKDSLKENMSYKRRYHCIYCDHTYARINLVIAHIQKAHGKTIKQAQDCRSSIRKASYTLDSSKAEKKNGVSPSVGNKSPSKASPTQAAALEKGHIEVVDSEVTLNYHPNRRIDWNNVQGYESESAASKVLKTKLKRRKKAPAKKRSNKSRRVSKPAVAKLVGRNNSRGRKDSLGVLSKKGSYRKAMDCESCHKRFHTIFGWRRHARVCKNGLDREDAGVESVVEILRNQPVIVLNRLDSLNMPLPGILSSGPFHRLESLKGMRQKS